VNVTILLVLAAGVLFFIALLSGFYALFTRRVRVEERLGRETKPAESAIDARALLNRIGDIIRPLGEVVPRSAEEMSKQERKLVQAGIRRKDSTILFYAIQVGVAIFLLIAFAVSGYLYQNPLLYVVLAVLAGAALPDMWLQRKRAARQEQIQHALPDAMDLAVISMEAGLGLDQTLLRVGQEFEKVHPELSEEFRLHNLEMNLGRTRVQAFRNLAERTGVEDLRALVAVLIQTDRFGTSIAQALRTFSDTLRTKRRQRAEERAAQLPVKMIIPMVLFIFPAVLVVIVGPGFLAIFNNLLPTLSGN
jgi:tight adherence protein C